MENQPSEKLPRLTFEDVLANQLRLRTLIRKFIRENRCIDGDGGDDFVMIYSRATLGRGALVELGGRYPGPAQQTIDDVVLNSLYGGNYRSITVGWRHSSRQENVPVARIWREVMIKLNQSVFGVALQQAVSLSPEKAPWAKQPADRV